MRSIIFIMFCIPVMATAFINKSFYAGLGYFSENSLGRITASADGKALPLLATTTYPLLLKYDWQFSSDYFLSSNLTYTFINRKSAANSAEINIWHLMFPVGKNFNSNDMDWYVGPGVLNRTIKGKGGLVTLNNGTSFATFALPGRTITTRVITLVTGASYTVSSTHRLGFDLITEGLLSNKRTFDLMFSYAYSFGKGF